MILGHNHPRVTEAITTALHNGISFGAPCELETKLGNKVCNMIPSIERIRFVNSGTEATMSALRVARAATGRNKIIKFEGNYHGHHDSLLVKAGSGAMTLGQPSSAGVPDGFTEYTLIAQYNDPTSVKQLFDQYGSDIAGIIVEPVAGNMGCVPPKPGFLESLRQLCNQHDSVLIFDEVMTGFRIAQGGAQAYYQVMPDLTALGKIVGGGMPVGAFGGRDDIMSLIAPEGPVYQAGTLAGNPLAMAAGLATLNVITDTNGFYSTISETATQLAEYSKKLASDYGMPMVINQVGGMLSIFFSDQNEIATHEQVKQCHTTLFASFFQKLIQQNVYWPPSPFESAFISIAHDQEILAATKDALAKAISQMSEAIANQS
jgi:glutamate-1-semialdehyde 2,1-aminomutase